MYKRLITTRLAIFSTLCLFLVFQAGLGVCAVDQGETGYLLNDVIAEIQEESMTITLAGSTAPAFTSRELYDPYRLIIDIAGVTLADKLDIDSLIPENNFTTLNATIVKGLQPEITRLAFSIKDGFKQKLEREGNDLVISITPLAENAEQPQKMAQESVGVVDDSSTTPEATVTDTTIQELIDNSVQAMGADGGNGAVSDLEKSFDFSGYKRERISIDFYKIDLHNVFRLFRQISGLNLIIDEGVSGSITLALKNVPWDFALDIILNLAELKKEERFNTVVIYPKNKEFEWPQRTVDNLTFEANLEVVEQEALIIEQSANQPKEIMQAKELMRQARIEEKNNDFEDAANLYVQAMDLWPSNGNLSTKLAALYLVRLGMNAKAAYYAKKSIEVDPENHKAALYAAISMANMNKNTEAVEYFNQSISGDPPMKEALASFAAFSETNGQPQTALELYDKYNEVYGETVNTMVAKARILDGLGEGNKAATQYKAILASGFPIPPGLKDYIESRLSQ